MNYSISLPRGSTIAFLASIYALGFLVSPYWALYTSTGSVIFHAFLTIAIGLVWLLVSTSSLQVEIRSKEIASLLILSIGVIALNYRALNSVIPFRGDEGLHIERTLELVQRMPLIGAVLLVSLFILLIVAGFKRQTWMFPIAVLIIVAVIFFYLGRTSFQDVETTPVFFVRYPFINYWFYAIAPKLASVLNSQYHEVLYRIVPVFSMIGAAWIFQKKVHDANPFVNIAWGIAAATIPLTFYYSSILYLEPPAVFLMTIVCLDSYPLLHKDNRQILKIPSWYALILIGFVKETTLPFLIGFLIVRTIVQLQIWWKEAAKQKSLVRLLIDESLIAFSLLIPLFLYLYFRMSLASTRSYAFQLSNLLDLTAYPVIVRAFLEQFGFFLFLFIAGCVVLIINRDLKPLFFYGFVLFVVLIFFVVDKESLIGYSRFNLFCLPPILAGSTVFIKWVTQRKQWLGNVLVLVAIGSNLLVSPVHLDGVKTAYWGNYRRDTSEHYYPYQDALLWLKKHYANRRMLFTGLDYYYPFQFYWNKLDWKPRRAGIPSASNPDETLAISHLLKDAETESYDIVVYRVIHEKLVLPEQLGAFRTEIIKNSAHTLIIFYKP